jgi:hypothetical protein
MAGRNYLNDKISPLGLASDKAKPYQIYGKQRCCDDVNFLKLLN